jgi:hypothetical protein
LRTRIWELRHNFTAYDAAYVALAETTNAVLYTTDAKLCKGHHARVMTLIPTCPEMDIGGDHGAAEALLRKEMVVRSQLHHNLYLHRRRFLRDAEVGAVGVVED